MVHSSATSDFIGDIFVVATKSASTADWVTAVFTAVGAIAAAVGIVIALVQLRHLKREVVQDFDWRRRVKTDELARSFSREIAPLITYIIDALRKSGAMAYVEMIRDDQMTKFTTAELHEISHNVLKGVPEGVSLADKADELLCAMSIDDWKICHGSIPEDVRHEIDPNQTEEALKQAYKNEYYAVQTETVNRMITFCNSIDFDLAVEDMIYPLTHDAFFQGVRVCYFRIARQNKLGSHQNAYSVQRVYLKWQNRVDEHVVRGN